VLSNQLREWREDFYFAINAGESFELGVLTFGSSSCRVIHIVIRPCSGGPFLAS